MKESEVSAFSHTGGTTADPSIPSALTRRYEGLISEDVSFKVLTPAGHERAAKILIEVNGLKKEFEEFKEFLLAPLKRHVKDVNAFFNGYLGPIGKVDKALRDSICVYLRAQGAGEVEKSVRPTGGGRVTTRAGWGFKVTDPSLVPREYFSIDEGKIRGAILGGVRSIPGVEVIEEVGLQVFTGEGQGR